MRKTKEPIVNKKTFNKHFRIYFKNGHPAYIIDEEGNMYVFHRVTHSKTSGGRNDIEIENPLLRSEEKTSYIVKREEKDKKGRFSLFELELKPGVDANNLKIKKAGGSQTSVVNNVTTSIDDNKLTNNALAQKRRLSSRCIKSNKRKKGKRK